MKKRIRTSEYQIMDIRESEYQDYLLVVPDLLVSLFLGSWNLVLGTWLLELVLRVFSNILYGARWFWRKVI